MMKAGDRVRGLYGIFAGEEGTVTRRMKQFEGYSVLYDNRRLRGPLGDGAVYMQTREIIQIEEETE